MKEPKFKEGDEVIWCNESYRVSRNFGHIFFIGQKCYRNSEYWVYSIIGDKNDNPISDPCYLEDAFRKTTKLDKALK